MPKSIIALVLAGAGIIALGIILFFAQPKAISHDGTDNAPGLIKKLNISIAPPSYNFGTIAMKNGPVTKVFEIKNEQGSALAISELYTSCMCTSAKIQIGSTTYGPFGMPGHGAAKMLNQSLAPGETAELAVTFDPNAHGPSGIGLIERTVTLKSNGSSATVNIKANVTP